MKQEMEIPGKLFKETALNKSVFVLDYTSLRNVRNLSPQSFQQQGNYIFKIAFRV